MRIAVTGATGNLGTALLRRLSSNEESSAYDVVGLARRLPDDQGSAADWVSVDITRDDCAASLHTAFSGVDAVVHLAWGFQPSHRPDYLEELGVGGTRRVLAAAISADVPHLIHMSSVGAYSPKVDDSLVDESWPTTGIPGSPYSRHKALAERLLDAHVASGAGPRITRMRPGIVGQRTAGSALLRYGAPGYVPAAALNMVSVLPIDRRLRIPMVHADDVATAVELVLKSSSYGAFNLAAEPPLTGALIAQALGARTIHMPTAVLRPAVALAWRAHLLQLDPGWIDLAIRVPLLDTTRARDALGWAPTVDATAALHDTVSGMLTAAAGTTPVLRQRTLAGRVGDLLGHGPVSRRSRP